VGDDDRSAVVVGGGVIGLTTAIRLLDSGWRVRVVAADPPERTTSAVAAASWYPFGVELSDRTLAWARTSHTVLRGQVGSATGVHLRQGWKPFRTLTEDPVWAPIVGGVTRLPPERLPAGCVDGYEFTTVIVDMPRYLRWLVQQVLGRGGTLELRAIASLREPREQAALVVNCSGLGARELAADADVLPVRGQVVWVTNPGLTRFLLGGEHPDGPGFIYPRQDDCVLGGTYEEGRSDLEPDPATTERILRICRRMEPALADAELIGARVGVRPWRRTVRLELDTGPGGGAALVHNYGHGGGGVTLSWGCADEVARLAGNLTGLWPSLKDLTHLDHHGRQRTVMTPPTTMAAEGPLGGFGRGWLFPSQ